mmetsp:Transcript_13177/g.38322  ORF Transcript_13177/g.38322 Transcript_13177/m.38322 type:complete len:425 (+) Transcript_13177:721-1995(+)
MSMCSSSWDAFSLGAAFVSYGSKQEAERAIFALHRKVFLVGSQYPLEVRFARSYCYVDSGAGPPDNRQLFFKSAPQQATESDLRTVFGCFGTVEDVVLFRSANTGQFRGSGFVTMRSRESALLALTELNGRHYMLGSYEPLTVKWADPDLRLKKQHARESNDIVRRGLFFARVPYAATDAHVEALFMQFGSVTQVTLIRDFPRAPLSKGFGFVTMSSADEAIIAINALNERHTWPGMSRPMVVTFMNRRLQRQHMRQQNMQRAVSSGDTSVEAETEHHALRSEPACNPPAVARSKRPSPPQQYNTNHSHHDKNETAAAQQDPVISTATPDIHISNSDQTAAVHQGPDQLQSLRPSHGDEQVKALLDQAHCGAVAEIELRQSPHDSTPTGRVHKSMSATERSFSNMHLGQANLNSSRERGHEHSS